MLVPPLPSFSSQPEAWAVHRTRLVEEKRTRRYAVFAAEQQQAHALKLQSLDPGRFKVFPISWDKFPDGTDNITMSGFSPRNEIAGEHVIFFASFHNNDVTLSQFSALIVLLQSFIESLTIILPFYPVGTMERVDVEGKVATANTYSILLSNLPSIGKPARIMIYDIHTLQNRFYFHGSTIASLHTGIPLLLAKISARGIDAVAFPDDGSAKRFGRMFESAGLEKIVCGKIRDGNKRIVQIQDGDPNGKSVVIVDDLVQTGGTLYECAIALRNMGAVRVSAYVTHAVFPRSCWKEFCASHSGSKAAVFDTFWVTNSIPSVTNHLPQDDVFEVLDLVPQVLADLDMSR